MKNAIAIATLAALSAVSAAPAFAGPYVGGKVAAKGTDEDFKKTETELRVGYEAKVGALKHYIEVGPAWEMKEGEDEASFYKQLEVGSKIKMTDNLGAKVKAEYTIDDDSAVDWKYEASISYDF